MKNQKEILEKLKIQSLNEMQSEFINSYDTSNEFIVLSPTGSGKTLAFLLPIIARLDKSCHEVQCLIVAPTRELVMQIEQVAKNIGSGFKVNAIYGGRSGKEDKIDLKHPPAILIGSPGRIADKLRRKSFSVKQLKTIVLDEFDKSLENGFASEMIEIVDHLSNLEKKILTSATNKSVPDFLKIKNPKRINHLKKINPKLTLKQINCSIDEKKNHLYQLICHLRKSTGIVFCNFKDTVSNVSDFLRENKVDFAIFHGGMEQHDREKSLIKFRNGSVRLLIATDLAARGIDIPEINFIIHYELAKKENEFIHRNGRTARMGKNGVAYIFKNSRFDLPEYISNIETEDIKTNQLPHPSIWKTVMLNGGKRDKISKGDLLGFFIKEGGLVQEDIGIMEIKQESSYVAIHSNYCKRVVKELDNKRIKKKKVRISII